MFTLPKIVITSVLSILGLVVSLIIWWRFTRWYFALLLFVLWVLIINIIWEIMSRDQEKRDRELLDDAFGSA